MTDSERLLRTAYLFAWAMSADPVTKNAAIIVREMTDSARINGVNFPMNGAKVCDEPKGVIASLEWYHAEAAAIAQAKKYGYPTRGAIMVCPWACCQACAETIVGSGIAILIVHAQAIERTPERWQEEVAAGHGLIKAAGVELVMHDGALGDCFGMMNGEKWTP